MRAEARVASSGRRAIRTTRLLSPLPSSDVAGLIENADAPHHLFQPLNWLFEHAERAGRAGLVAADDVAFEEQLAGCCACAPPAKPSTDNATAEAVRIFMGMPSRATDAILGIVDYLTSPATAF